MASHNRDLVFTKALELVLWCLRMDFMAGFVKSLDRSGMDYCQGGLVACVSTKIALVRGLAKNSPPNAKTISLTSVKTIRRV